MCGNLTKELLRNLLRQNEIFIVGIPGQHFGDNSKLFSAAIGLLKTLAFKFLLGVKFLKIGTSIGPLSRPLIQVERAKSNLYEIYDVRDTNSRDLCSPSKVEYFPDLAFISEDFPTRIHESSDDYVVLSFRQHTSELNLDESYLQKIIELLASYFSTTEEINIVVAFQVRSDKAACTRIYNSLKELKHLRIKLLDGVLDLKQSIELIGNSKCVISNRLHVLLPALIMGVPHVCLVDVEKHIKIAALYHDIGASFLLHDINDSNGFSTPSESISGRLVRIAKHQKEIALKELSQTFG